MACRSSRPKFSGSPAAMLNMTTMLPMSSVSWLTPGRYERAHHPSTGLACRLNRTATMISGDSDASGATHWIRMNSSMPRSSPVPTSASTKGSAATRMTAAA